MRYILFGFVVFFTHYFLAKTTVFHFSVEAGLGINYSEIKVLINGNEIGNLNAQGSIEYKGDFEELMIKHLYLASNPTFWYSKNNNSYYHCNLSHQGSKFYVKQFMPDFFEDSLNTKLNLEDEVSSDEFKQAEYTNGLSELRKDLAKEIRYPFDAVDNYYQGKVILKLKIDAKNSIEQIYVVYTPYLSLAKEAVRVAYELKKFKSATLNGVPIESYYTIPINFVLN